MTLCALEFSLRSIDICDHQVQKTKMTDLVGSLMNSYPSQVRVVMAPQERVVLMTWAGPAAVRT